MEIINIDNEMERCPNCRIPLIEVKKNKYRCPKCYSYWGYEE
jgi:uncharacterized Zn finger protein (UPF0148 family)